ncbi:MAG: alpha/beta hydrolase-fold protein [Acidobacteriota bacterium]
MRMTPVFAFALLAGTMVPLLAQVPAPAVDFLENPPSIDGALEPAAAELPARPLAYAVRDDGEALSQPYVTCRLAYGAEFLYVALQAPAVSLVSRDRAYQNGDGFHMALCAPLPDGGPSREFYVLGFSPGADAAHSRQRAFVWYRNVDLAFTPLEGTLLAARVAEGTATIELLLPWRQVYPFHPWLSPGIGFNLCYVQGTGETGRIYHFALPDDRLQSEQSPRRYVPLTFSPPRLASGARAFAVLDRNHCFTGEKIALRFAVLTASDQVLPARTALLSGEGETLSAWRSEIAAPRGLTVGSSEVACDDLPPGGYTVRWTWSEEVPAAEMGLSVLSGGGSRDLSRRLERARGQISPGSAVTLAHRIQEAEAALAALKPTDTAAPIRIALARIEEILQAASRGEDRIASQSGVVRRAYRSKVDGTLQPYSVWVPPSLPPGRKVPVMVFLHGSGEDDRSVFRGGSGRVPPDFLGLAPNGRGTSNCYSADNAQEDIREALADLLANYPGDPDRVVLAGFSMGGYGVYRTFLEAPGAYRALAVFSGSPDLAVRFLGPGHPDFLAPGALAPFRGARLFIFHGGRDRNCPVEQTRRLVEGLRAAGAEVEYHEEADKGHDAPGSATLAAFDAWLRRVLS